MVLRLLTFSNLAFVHLMFPELQSYVRLSTCKKGVLPHWSVRLYARIIVPTCDLINVLILWAFDVCKSK